MYPDKNPPASLQYELPETYQDLLVIVQASMEAMYNHKHPQDHAIIIEQALKQIKTFVNVYKIS